MKLCCGRNHSHVPCSRDSVMNGRGVIGSVSKPQLRRTRSFSDIGGKRVASLMLEGEETITLQMCVIFLIVSAAVVSDAPRGRANSAVGNIAIAQAPAAVEKEGDDASERYSEFVSQILLACRENKGLCDLVLLLQFLVLITLICSS